MRELFRARPTRSGTVRACSIHRDHDVGGLHHHGNGALGLDAQFIDRLIGDRGGDDLAVADVDADMGSGGALFHFDDGAFDLVACTDAHGGSFCMIPRMTMARIDKSGDERGSAALLRSLASAYGAAMGKLSAVSGRMKSAS